MVFRILLVFYSGSLFSVIITVRAVVFVCSCFEVHLICFRGDVEKRTALENLDLILLCIDEIIDGG
jgi:hypothetical protein